MRFINLLLTFLILFFVNTSSIAQKEQKNKGQSNSTSKKTADKKSNSNSNKTETIECNSGFPPSFYFDGSQKLFGKFCEKDKLTKYTVKIINSSGVEVFVTNEISSGWDGMYKGKLISPGKYMWQITGYNSKNSFTTLMGACNFSVK